jgi:hypothetical protein
MSKTDRRGRDLKTFLQAEVLARDVTVKELRRACGGLSVARYYGDAARGTSGRASADDFPNTEELRHIAEFYGLGDEGYLNLLIEFGWLSQRPDAPGFTAGGAEGGPLVVRTKGALRNAAANRAEKRAARKAKIAARNAAWGAEARSKPPA